jgi:hypothetical protein
MPEAQVWPADSCFDVMPLLDQELSRLPEKYRLPIVLCDLEGKGHGEAARQLGWPQGTVSGRLSRARRLLAQRLTRRGVGLSAVAIGAVLAEQAKAVTVSPALLSATVKAAGCVAAGKALAGVVSAKVAALTECAVKSLLVSKLKVTVSVALFFSVFALGTGLGRRTLHHQDYGSLTSALVADNVPAAQGKNPRQPPNQAFQITFNNFELVLVEEPDRSVIGLLRDNIHLPFVPHEACADGQQLGHGQLRFRAEGDFVIAFQRLELDGCGYVLTQRPKKDCIRRLFDRMQHPPFAPASVSQDATGPHKDAVVRNIILVPESR